MSTNEAAAIVAALRAGLVPKRGLEHLVTGLDPLWAAVAQELDYVGSGRGLSKWVRGEYGTGKTFATRYLCAKAREKKFVTAEVQISINDTPLHHLETVYRRLVERLETAADGVNALQAIVEGWLYQVGEEVTRLRGIRENDPDFVEATEERLDDKLAEISRRNPAFAAVLRGYHRALDRGDFGTAQGLLGWLSGQPHTDKAVLREAGITGKVDGQASLAFLAGLLFLVRQSGYCGLVVVLDEVETIQRANALTREKALNALRQLMDMLAKDELPGMYLMVTGTRDFFEGYKGLRALGPLYQRVHVNFGEDARFDNLRAPQVRLLPFDEGRLLEVGKKVRDVYPTPFRERVVSRVNDGFLRALVSQVTAGFGGKVQVAPRLFLRELVDVLDRVDQHEGYDPAEHYRLEMGDDSRFSADELAAKYGRAELDGVDEVEEVDGVDEGDPSVTPRRLDG